MSYTELAQDVIKLLDHLAIESCYMLGHSMGGKIAMKIALASPQKIKKLIVADIAPKYYAPHHHTIIDALNLVNSQSKDLFETTIEEFNEVQIKLSELNKTLNKVDADLEDELILEYSSKKETPRHYT